MALNIDAIEAARQNLTQGAVTPHYGPWSEDIITLLNDALATEEAAHADRVAKRIVQLGGSPDVNPDSLSKRSHAAYDG